MDGLVSICFPLVEIENFLTDSGAEMTSIVSLGITEDNYALGFKLFIDKTLEPYYIYNEAAENNLDRNEQADWLDGGAFFGSLGDATLLLCRFLATGVSPPLVVEQERNYVVASSLLLFGDLSKLKDFSPKEKLQLEKISALEPPLLDFREGDCSEQIILRMRVLNPDKIDESNAEGSVEFADVIINIDLAKKRLWFNEKDSSMRKALLEAFAITKEA